MKTETGTRLCANCGSAGSISARTGRCEVCGHTNKERERDARMMQIGEVAAHAGLSLRTVRYYEEVGLVSPSGRTDGGFRLYTDEDLTRLLLVKRMKPLELSLEEVREVLDIRDSLEGDDLSEAKRRALEERLAHFVERATDRCAALRARLEAAEALVEDLRRTAGETPNRRRVQQRR